jgi:hypothetical protein
MPRRVLGSLLTNTVIALANLPGNGSESCPARDSEDKAQHKSVFEHDVHIPPQQTHFDPIWQYQLNQHDDSYNRLSLKINRTSDSDRIPFDDYT